jgi:ABC-type sugar transport system permease subunit
VAFCDECHSIVFAKVKNWGLYEFRMDGRVMYLFVLPALAAVLVIAATTTAATSYLAFFLFAVGLGGLGLLSRRRRMSGLSPSDKYSTNTKQWHEGPLQGVPLLLTMLAAFSNNGRRPQSWRLLFHLTKRVSLRNYRHCSNLKKSPSTSCGEMFMREFLIVTTYAAFMLIVMAVIIAFIGITSPTNACERNVDGNGNIVRCP